MNGVQGQTQRLIFNRIVAMAWSPHRCACISKQQAQTETAQIRTIQRTQSLKIQQNHCLGAVKQEAIDHPESIVTLLPPSPLPTQLQAEITQA